MNIRPDAAGFLGDADVDLEAALKGSLNDISEKLGIQEITTIERDYATSTELYYVHGHESDLHEINTRAHEHMRDAINIAKGTLAILTSGAKARQDLLQVAANIQVLAAEIEASAPDQERAAESLSVMIHLHEKLANAMNPMFVEMHHVSSAVVAYELNTGMPEAKYVTVENSNDDDPVYRVASPGARGSVLVTAHDVERFQKLLGDNAELTEADADYRNFIDNAVTAPQLMKAMQEYRFLEDRQYIQHTLAAWGTKMQHSPETIATALYNRDMNAMATYDLALALRMIEKMPSALREQYEAKTIDALLNDNAEFAFDNAAYASLNKAENASHFRDFLNGGLYGAVTLPMLATMGAKIAENPAVLMENIPAARADASHTLQSVADEINAYLETVKSEPAPAPSAETFAPQNLAQAAFKFTAVWNEASAALLDMIDIAYQDRAQEDANVRHMRDALYARVHDTGADVQNLLNVVSDQRLNNTDDLTYYRQELANSVRTLKEITELTAFAETRGQIAHDLKQNRALKNPGEETLQQITLQNAQLSLLDSRDALIRELENTGSDLLMHQAIENQSVQRLRRGLYSQLMNRLAEREDQRIEALTDDQRKTIITRLMDEIHADTDVVTILKGLHVAQTVVNKTMPKSVRKIIKQAADARDQLLQHVNNRFIAETFIAENTKDSVQNLGWRKRRALTRALTKANATLATLSAQITGCIDALYNAPDNYMTAYAKYAEAQKSAAQKQMPVEKIEPQLAMPAAEPVETEQPFEQPEYSEEQVQAQAQDEFRTRLAAQDRIFANPIVDAEGKLLGEPEFIHPAVLAHRRAAMEDAMRTGGGTAPQDPATFGDVPEWLINRESRQQPEIAQDEPLDEPLPLVLQQMRDENINGHAPAVDGVSDHDRDMHNQHSKKPRKTARRMARRLKTRLAYALRSSAATPVIAEQSAPAPEAVVDTAPRIGASTRVNAAAGAALLGTTKALETIGGAGIATGTWAYNATRALGRAAPGMLVGIGTGYAVRVGTGAAAAALGSVFLTGVPLIAVTGIAAMVAGRYMGRFGARYSSLNRESLQAGENIFAAPVKNLFIAARENFNGELKGLHVAASMKFGQLMTDAHNAVKEAEANGKQTRIAKFLNKTLYYPRLVAAANRIDQQTFALHVGTKIGMWSALAGSMVTHALMASPVPGVKPMSLQDTYEQARDFGRHAKDQISTLVQPEPVDTPLEQPVRIETPSKIMTDHAPIDTTVATSHEAETLTVTPENKNPLPGTILDQPLVSPEKGLVTPPWLYNDPALAGTPLDQRMYPGFGLNLSERFNNPFIAPGFDPKDPMAVWKLHSPLQGPVTTPVETVLTPDAQPATLADAIAAADTNTGRIMAFVQNDQSFAQAVKLVHEMRERGVNVTALERMLGDPSNPKPGTIYGGSYTKLNDFLNNLTSGGIVNRQGVTTAIKGLGEHRDLVLNIRESLSENLPASSFTTRGWRAAARFNQLCADYITGKEVPHRIVRRMPMNILPRHKI